MKSPCNQPINCDCCSRYDLTWKCCKESVDKEIVNFFMKIVMVLDTKENKAKPLARVVAEVLDKSIEDITYDDMATVRKKLLWLEINKHCVKPTYKKNGTECWLLCRNLANIDLGGVI